MRLNFSVVFKSLCGVIGVVAIFLLLTASGFSEQFPDVTAILWIVGVVFVLYNAASQIIFTKNDAIVFFSSLTVRIGYMIYKFGFRNLAEPKLSEDANRFWKVARMYYEGDFSVDYTPYPHVLNAQFHVFGSNILCCIMVNVALVMVMALLYFSLMDMLQIRGRGRQLGAFIVCFMPYSFIISTSLLREAIYYCFIMASFVLYVKYIICEKHRFFYYSVLLLIPVLYMHIGYFPIVFAYLIDMYRNEKIRTKKQLFYRCLLVGLIVLFVGTVLGFNSMRYLVGSSGGIEGILNKLLDGTPGETTIQAGSRYLAGVRITSIGTLILYAPLKWFFYLFSPLPVNWRGLSDIISFLFDGFIHFLVIIGGIKYIMQKKEITSGHCEWNKKRICSVALWAVVLCAGVFGLGTATAGTAMRHRAVMIGIEAVIVAIAVSGKSAFLNSDAKKLERKSVFRNN